MRKKIIFLNPTLTPFQRYGELFQAGAQEPPIGLAYLASITKNIGLETQILDALALGIDMQSAAKIILREKPDFLGITLSTMSLNISTKIARALKKENPDIKIIVGGCHFTSLPEQTLQENSYFDIGVIGEGEETLAELLKATCEGAPLYSIKGIAFRDNGKIMLTLPRKRISDLDSLPLPAFELLPKLNKYYRVPVQSIRVMPTTSLITSRGCTGHCLFCDRKTFGNELRMHSAEYVVDMMEKLQNDFGIKGVIFEDDNFMISEKRLHELERLINKRKIRIVWSAMSRVDTITEEKLKIVKSCGCWQILYGIESGSQKILDFYNKKITLPQIKETIRLTRKYDIYSKGFFMLGNPLESEETLWETKGFINNLPLDDISVTLFTPYPGADIWQTIEEFGECDKDWDKFTCFDAVFKPKGMYKKDIIRWQKNILKEFYSQPRVIWSYLTRLRSLSQIKILYESCLGFISYYKSRITEKEVIINADDFGLCNAINRGIMRLINRGIIKSISILPTGYAFEPAVNIIEGSPELDVGVHLSLIETKPILPKDKISSLVNKRGYFESKFLVFLLRYLLGQINKKQIINEFRAQIIKIKEKGIKISHIDSHQHIHVIPGIFNIVIKLAKEYRIPFIRLPLIPINRRYFSAKVSLIRKLCQLAINFICLIYKSILKKNGINFCDYSFGFLESGHLAKENIKDIISSLKNGKYELLCHPGEEDDDLRYLIGHWGYNWQLELEDLSSNNMMDYLNYHKIQLTKFGYDKKN